MGVFFVMAENLGVNFGSDFKTGALVEALRGGGSGRVEWSP